MRMRVMAAGRLVGGAATAVMALLCMPAESSAQTTGPAERPAVIVAAARTAELVDRVEALGTTRANESLLVTANVTEKIAEIRFEDGQAVNAGDVLTVLAMNEEEADLAAAQAILVERRLAHDRAVQLERQQFTAKAQLDERLAELREAEARIAVIKARIEDRTIRAPFAGLVGLRNVSVGTLVEPGDVITTLDDISVIKLDFTVPSTHLTTLKPGLGIVARASAFGDRTFIGEIRSVDTRVDPVTRSVIARAVLPNPDGTLKPGLLLTVQLLKNPRTAIVVPEEALVPRGRITHVLVVDEAADNMVVQREVTIGARQPGIAEILGGLNEGEKVITRGTLQVRPGQRVSIKAIDDGGQPLPRLLDAGGGGRS
jgi:membrane fusion protein (multidrug efflux system)